MYENPIAHDGRVCSQSWSVIIMTRCKAADGRQKCVNWIQLSLVELARSVWQAMQGD